MAGGARNVAVRYGWSWQVRRGLLGNGAVLCGLAGTDGLGVERSGLARIFTVWQVRRSVVRRGLAWC